MNTGKFGVYCTTDRFNLYDISNNLIYNIENPITFNSTYGQINFGASTYTNSQYAGLTNINYNTIAPVASGAIGSEFVSNAISVANVLSSGSTSTLTANAQVNTSGNVMRNVYRGINASNYTTPAFMAQNNTCTLTLDPGSNLQTGITIDACSNPSVQLNTITGPASTNTITTGIYASMNTAPKVTCNTVQSTYQGFEFAGSQPGTKWKGNSMTTHTLGFALTYTGVIGAQGSAGNPIDNVWNGTTWTGTNYQTWTSNSTATSSPIWVQNTATTYSPTNNYGNPFAWSYLVATSINTTTGVYSCSGGGARYGNINTDTTEVQAPTKGSSNYNTGNEKIITGDVDYLQAYFKTLEDIAGYSTYKNTLFEPANFIAQYQLFKVIDCDLSYYQSNTKLSNFYANNKNKSYGKLLDGEMDLKNGNYSSAVSALVGISSKNNIETNYNNFYNLYGKYYSKTFSGNDNTTLLTLANKCPFIEGEVIYQARTLYNIINSTVELFKDNCPNNSSSSRLFNSSSVSSNWIVNLFPNPASNELFIKTSNEAEDLKVTITDVNGRIVGDFSLKTNSYTANLKLNLNSGIYFVTLSSSENEKVIKKLIIAK